MGKDGEMTDPFDTFIATITKKTGKSPKEIRDMLKKTGVLVAGVRAGAIVSWLKVHLELGHGHAMAIVR
jgi:hypothetical protein